MNLRKNVEKEDIEEQRRRTKELWQFDQIKKEYKKHLEEQWQGTKELRQFYQIEEQVSPDGKTPLPGLKTQVELPAGINLVNLGQISTFPGFMDRKMELMGLPVYLRDLIQEGYLKQFVQEILNTNGSYGVTGCITNNNTLFKTIILMYHFMPDFIGLDLNIISSAIRGHEEAHGLVFAGKSDFLEDLIEETFGKKVSLEGLHPEVIGELGGLVALAKRNYDVQKIKTKLAEYLNTSNTKYFFDAFDLIFD